MATLKPKEDLQFDKMQKQYEAEMNQSKHYSSNASITQYRTDLAFTTLMKAFDDNLYVIPKYQRNYIWSFEQVQELAISLVKGMPIPPIYVYKNEEKQMVILDGQQRIISLYLYYNSKYFKSSGKHIAFSDLLQGTHLLDEDVSFIERIARKYPLKDIEFTMEYKNKSFDITYSRLDRVLKRQVDYTNISLIEVKIDTKDEQDRDIALRKVFENLNRGGTTLEDQEIRNCVYQCSFYDMLHELNTNNIVWRKIYSVSGEKDNHSKDVELLLRLCAVSHYFVINTDNDTKSINVKVNNISNGYQEMLYDFSDVAQKFDTNRIEAFQRRLEEFIERIKTKKKIPALLLETMFFCIGYLKNRFDITEMLVNEILLKTSYKESAKSSITKKYVEERIRIVYEVLSQYDRSFKKQDSK